MMAASTLLLIDPNTLRASAFAALLAPWAHRSGTDLRVVHDLDEAIDTTAIQIAACLLDVGGLSLSDRGVIAMMDRLRVLYPEAPLVIFSDILDPFEIEMAIDNKLHGFIPTTMPTHVALAAVQFIVNGGTYHPHAPAVSTHAPVRHLGTHGGLSAQRPRQAPPERDNLEACINLEPLKKVRHIEVLQYLAQGETNKEIARRLKLTEATVKVYVRELMRHFGAKNRMQVALSSMARDAASVQPGGADDSMDLPEIAYQPAHCRHD